MYMGGEGRSNGVGIIISEEIGKEVVRVEIRQMDSYGMVGNNEGNGVFCRYMGHRREGLTEAEKQEFTLERMMGMV